MSAGPIMRERGAWKRGPVATTDRDRVCMAGMGPTVGRSYCGRSNTKNLRVQVWSAVVCWDCLAAALADGVKLPAQVIASMPR